MQFFLVKTYGNDVVPPGGTLNSALCRGTTDPNLVNSEEVDFSSDESLAYVANGQLSNATLAI